MGPDPPRCGRGPEVWGVPGDSRGQAKGKEGALSNVIDQSPVGGRSQRGEGRHRVLGEANPVASSREDGARVVNSPDAGMAQEVNDVGSWVILHERTGAVWGAEPIPQWCEKALSRTAEDLGEDRVPGSPASSQGVFNWPEEGAGRLWGKPGIEGRV